MAELCRSCFIETWRPNAYDIYHIVMSDTNEFCEGCMECVPYVDHIDRSDLRHTPTVKDYMRVVLGERRNGRNLACVECGAIFEDDDLAFVCETGTCPYCHKNIQDLWVK